MRILERAGQKHVDFPATVSSPYVNTIPSDEEPDFPGDEYLERRIRAYIRWNAAVMVVRANVRSEAIGGHLSTYASSASLYEVGFNHFFRGKDGGAPGDQVYFQGHASPGIYARAFVEGRLSEDQLDNFRFEVGGDGLSSYPHPRLMPEFWEYPTVSMGLGPLNAIAQAHMSRYLGARGLADTSSSRVWSFVGDGEFDEPETIGALGMAGREHLDNLVFVVNCNLQRLDGPVRGNGKVIQEFEALFRGAGWNVIKVIWGRTWDDLLAKDVEGVLLNKMNSTVDGEFQKYATESGAYIREHFFGPDPRLQALVAHLTDEELQSLPRGGHDYRKLYAAYKAATEHVGAPTAILAKTIKGWTLGPEIEARNATHQIKKMTKAQLLTLQEPAVPPRRDPRERPGRRASALLPAAPRREGGRLSGRAPPGPGRTPAQPGDPGPAPSPPQPDGFADLSAGSGRQAVSTTMAFARLLRSLVRDPSIGDRIVPIVSDEARTFGLESLISEVQIYAPEGQRYTPVDAGLALHYAESASGQVLQEGISEAGAVAAFTAAATSYATWGEPMIPFYLFYSMFGFQRVGDLLWALGDCRGRGFLLGCTAGRTTLNGEGLQHQDGHSLLLASTVPSVAAYDPAFSYEVAAIVEDGIRRMTGPEPEDRVWYLTLYNENYPMPALPTDEAEAERVRTGTIKGIYRYEPEEVSDPGRTRRSARGTRRSGDQARRGHPAVLRLGLAGDRRGPPPPQGGLGRRRLHLVGDLVQVAAGGRHLRRALEPPPSRGQRTCAVRHRVPVRVVRTDRRRHRLHAVGTRPGGPVDAPSVHLARHRRLRPLRHPGGPAAVLRGGCRPHRRGRPPRPGRRGTGGVRHSQRGHRPVRHRPGRHRSVGLLSPPDRRRAVSSGRAADPTPSSRLPRTGRSWLA